MTIEEIRNSLPDYAKDIKLNFSSIMTEEGSPDLNQKQIYSIILASAFTTKNKTIIQLIREEFSNYLSDIEINAIKSAVTIMAMNNIYYRFVHLVTDKSFSTMPAKLRMNIISNPGIPKTDFELICLAVSAINGCGMCIDAHTRELIKADISKTAIQSAIRIASVLNAVSMGMEIRS